MHILRILVPKITMRLKKKDIKKEKQIIYRNKTAMKTKNRSIAQFVQLVFTYVQERKRKNPSSFMSYVALSFRNQHDITIWANLRAVTACSFDLIVNVQLMHQH